MAVIQFPGAEPAGDAPQTAPSSWVPESVPRSVELAVQVIEDFIPDGMTAWRCGCGAFVMILVPEGYRCAKCWVVDHFDPGPKV